MQTDYAEKLEQLRTWLSIFREPHAVTATEGVPSAFTDVQIARRRFVLACLALDVPDEQITAAVPGFDPDIPGLRPVWTPSTPFSPEPYVLDLDPEKYVASQLRKCDSYLHNEVRQAHERFVKLKLSRPPAHRRRKLDLALRYFITVRHKLLQHSYAVIVYDHINPQPETAEQMAAAENRVRVAVHAVVQDVRLGCPVR
jgi:hypothetical protein